MNSGHGIPVNLLSRNENQLLLNHALSILRSFDGSTNGLDLGPLFALLVSLAHLPYTNVIEILEIFIHHLEPATQSCYSVLAYLDALHRILLIKSCGFHLGPLLVTTLQAKLCLLLTNRDPKIRSTSVELLSYTIQHSRNINLDLLRLLNRMLSDLSPYVRMATLSAFRELVLNRDESIAIDLLINNVQFESLLHDEMEEIRLLTIDIIWLLANGHNPAIVSDFRPDIVFVQMCDSVQDGFISVRARACQYIGTFRNISLTVLLQTLSKESMGFIKLMNSSNKKTLEMMEAGDYEISDDKINISKSSMCGAFIHALEDEFQVVRASAMNSICELGTTYREFAHLCLPFVIDMFNDETELIRLNAVMSVCKMAEKWPLILDESLSQSLLLVLHDSDPSIREAVYQMLHIVKINGIACFDRLVEVLLGSLTMFPSDQELILACLARLAFNHSAYVSNLSTKLLGIDPRFLLQELRLDNIQNIGTLIILRNASRVDGSIQARLPDHVQRDFPFVEQQYGRLWTDDDDEEAQSSKFSAIKDQIASSIAELDELDELDFDSVYDIQNEIQFLDTSRKIPFRGCFLYIAWLLSSLKNRNDLKSQTYDRKGLCAFLGLSNPIVRSLNTIGSKDPKLLLQLAKQAPLQLRSQSCTIKDDARLVFPVPRLHSSYQKIAFAMELEHFDHVDDFAAHFGDIVCPLHISCLQIIKPLKILIQFTFIKPLRPSTANYEESWTIFCKAKQMARLHLVYYM